MRQRLCYLNLNKIKIEKSTPNIGQRVKLLVLHQLRSKENHKWRNNVEANQPHLKRKEHWLPNEKTCEIL